MNTVGNHKSNQAKTGRSKKWLLTARWLALGFMLLCTGLFVLSMVQYHDFTARYPERNVPGAWTPAETDLILSRIGLSLAWWVEWNFITSILFAILMTGTGLFLYIRKSQDWFGLYLAVVFVMFGTLANNTTGMLSTLYPRWEPMLNPLGVIPWVGILMSFYLFPNGKFVPRWMAWVGLLIILAFGFNQVFNNGDTPPPYIMVPMMLLFVFAPIGQVYRYFKVSDPVEQLQTRWVMFAMTFVIILILTGFLPFFIPEMIDPDSSMSSVFVLLNSSYLFVFGLIPISITIAILRYRLWDVDVLIRKTMVYALMSGLLGLVYFGGVAVLQGVLTADRRLPMTDAVSSQPSAVVIVLTTLAIAGIFNPLRRRIQEFIDRRFYRQKYDSEKALSEFATITRTDVDMEKLTMALKGVVSETMQPEQIKLWLKPEKTKEQT